MLNNFYETTVLTGLINKEYMADFPNSLLIEKNSNYKLSILNKQFIMKYQIKSKSNFNQKYATQTLTLYINEDSINYTVDWGDNTKTIVNSMTYIPKQAVQNMSDLSVLSPGTYYTQTNTVTPSITHLYVFNGSYFTKVSYFTSNLYSLKDKVCIIEKDEQNNYSLTVSTEKITSHLYAYGGTYCIKIQGGFTGLNNINKGSNMYSTQNNSLLQILSWGANVSWNTLQGAFYGANKLIKIPEQKLPNVNDCSSAFFGCTELQSIPQFDFLPHALINSSYMFANASSLVADLSKYKVSPYNTVIDHMYYNTKVENIPQKFMEKSYIKYQNCFTNSHVSGAIADALNEKYPANTYWRYAEVPESTTSGNIRYTQNKIC